MTPSFEIRLLPWSQAIEQARLIRERVFIEEQNVPRALEWDEWDATSLHALAINAQGQCIGTARLLTDGRLGRMAVLREWRRRGVGTALARSLLRAAHDSGMAQVTLHAQTHAAGFYRQLGFVEHGPIFDAAGIPHVHMTLNLMHSTSAFDSKGEMGFGGHGAVRRK